MVDLDSSKVKGEIIEGIDPYLGPPLGALLVVISIILMLQGHRRIMLISGLSGAAIGFMVGELAHPLITEHIVELKLIHVRLILAAICAGILLALFTMAFRIMAFGIMYFVISSMVKYLESTGVDVEGGNVLSGIAAFVAFFFAYLLRHIMPVIASAILGSVMCVCGVLMLIGEPVTEVDARDTTILIISAALFFNSLILQRRDAKKYEQRQIEAELDKEMGEQPTEGADAGMVRLQRERISRNRMQHSDYSSILADGRVARAKRHSEREYTKYRFTEIQPQNQVRK